MQASAHNHQNKNTKYLQDLGLAWYVVEQNLLHESAFEVAKIINSCMSDKNHLYNKINALDRWAKLDRPEIHQEIIKSINFK